VRLDQEEAGILAGTYRLPRRDRVALLELTELASIRSLADKLAWVTLHKFRKTAATILDHAGHSARRGTNLDATAFGRTNGPRRNGLARASS
jgi:hypothetical protein